LQRALWFWKGEIAMSLDVYLTVEGVVTLETEERIFIRENRQNKQTSRTEWDERFPGREPVTVSARIDTSGTVFSANITHNLGKMADEAGIYKYLWRPDELGVEKAQELIEPLQSGLSLLEDAPERFKALNPPNGWGTYEGLVNFVRDYLDACKKYPGAEVSVWR